MGTHHGNDRGAKGSMQPMSLTLPLTLLLLACGPSAAPLAEGLPAAADATHDLVASEEVLLHLSPTLPLLASDLIDGRLPGAASRESFDSVLVVADLAPAPATARPLPHAEARKWASGPAGTISVVDADLLAPARALIAEPEHAKLKFVRGRFDSPDRRTWQADVSVSLSGRGADGDGVSFHASVDTLWRWTEGPDGPRWALSRFAVTEADVVRAPTPLFEETLGQRVPDPDTLVRARQNLHELKIVAHLADRSVHPDLELESFDRHPGVAVGDIDGDGRDDILATQRWGRPLLLVQQPDGTFRDEAEARGLTVEDHCSAALLLDLDNDGDTDLLLGRTLAPSMLYDNDGGFLRDVSDRVSGGLPPLVSHLAAGDLDGDGLLDVHVSQYAASRIEKTWEWHQRDGRTGPYLTGLVPDADAEEIGRRARAGEYERFLARPGPRNVVLKNLGAGRFTTVDGPGVDALRPFRNTYATVFSDLDGDGDLDAYLANDFSANVLARNDGGWTFTDVTEPSGTADFGFGMGAGVGDADGDGRMDLLVSNMFSKAGRRITAQLDDIDPRIPKAARGNSLFANEGDLRFRRISGTTPPAQTVEAAGWAWAGDIADLDMDGRNDLFVLSGNYTAPWQVAREHDC